MTPFPTEQVGKVSLYEVKRRFPRARRGALTHLGIPFDRKQLAGALARGRQLETVVHEKLAVVRLFFRLTHLPAVTMGSNFLIFLMMSARGQLGQSR